MLIDHKIDGGFAYIPALSKPRTFDTDQLTEADSQTLSRLVQQADFFNLPPHIGAASPGAADHRTHTLTITKDHHSHTIDAVEPIKDPNVAALVSELSRLNTVKPAG